MKNCKMWIGGKWVDAESGKTFTTVNPATTEEIARVPLAGKEDVDKAVAAANEAFPIWSKKSQLERSKIISKIAAAIRENAEELAQLDTMEHGTPINDSRHAMGLAAELMEYAAAASRAILGDYVPVDGNTTSVLKRVPLGVVALIIPWNLPVVVTCAKLGPALSIGNTCVIKPPSINSMVSLKFAEIISKVEGLPSGAINMITGPGGSVGELLATHPGIDAIGFTGSSATGKRIMAAASQTVKKCIMELGGKNAVIVMEDADLDKAVAVATGMQFNNCGQHCSSAGRYYVHESVYDKFVEKMVEAAKKVVVGDPADVKTTMGPSVSEEHQKSVVGYIKSGIEEGAKLMIGGVEKPAHLKGYYIMPTVFADAKHNMKIAREEIFGPVSVIMKYTSKDDIVKLANDSVYGLCASIWTKDIGKALRMAEDLRVGTVHINCHMLTFDQPWGTSVKESGLGKEGGLAGILEFTDIKMVNVVY